MSNNAKSYCKRHTDMLSRVNKLYDDDAITLLSDNHTKRFIELPQESVLHIREIVAHDNGQQFIEQGNLIGYAHLLGATTIAWGVALSNKSLSIFEWFEVFGCSRGRPRRRRSGHYAA